MQAFRAMPAQLLGQFKPGEEAESFPDLFFSLLGNQLSISDTTIGSIYT